jgi:rod shape-determining protein MreC
VPKKIFASKLLTFISIVIICAILLLINPRNYFGPFRSVLFTLFYPFEKIFYLTSGKIGNQIDFIGSISKLRAENEKLIRDNLSLEAQLASLKDEKKENELLRSQLGLIPKEKYDLLASFVIGQDMQESGAWITVDKGSFDGIGAGMPVIVSQGILVGKVEEVYPKSAKILLLTSPQSSVNAVDLETGSRGIIKGSFGLGVYMDMVTQSDVINVGDSIVTSGLGGNFPKGLLIGKITEVRLSQDKLFQQALISPSARYPRLEAVFIIKNEK